MVSRLKTHPESGVPGLLGSEASTAAEMRLLGGVADYRKRELPRYASLFEKLSEGQSPHTLFITCSDSRIQPSLITSTEPGELFLVRNVGNMVPPWRSQASVATGAAIEYAVGVLGVGEIVVCGHSRCGAIRALRAPEEIPAELSLLRAWAKETEAMAKVSELPRALPQDEVSRLNALRQLDHLATFPAVAQRLGQGKVRLHAWFFDVASGEVSMWSRAQESWEDIAPASIHREEHAEAREGEAGEVSAG
jgi:carbonic anhydrase